MVKVVVEGATKFYGGPNGFKALSDISVTAEDGEFLVLLGPSGSGKTTLLRTIAGLEDLDMGDIFIGDRRVTDMDPGQRNIGMVFQDYALYPHMTVRENIGYNMKIRGIARAEIDRRCTEVGSMLGLDGLLDRHPSQLSGGQRQRVALGRAITRDGSVLLMDEPLSNLDAQIREHVRVELHELQRRIGVTTIHVTHDQVEAMVIADRIAVMAQGRIEQIDEPETIYDNPQTLFCARFVGSPKINEIRGHLRRQSDDVLEFTIRAEDGADVPSLRIEAEEIALPGGSCDNAIMVFRPEDAELTEAGAGIPSTVLFVENRGAEKFAVVELPAHLRPAQSSDDLRITVDTRKAPRTMSFMPRRLHVFDEATGSRVASGRAVLDEAVATRTAGPRSAAAFSGDR